MQAEQNLFTAPLKSGEVSTYRDMDHAGFEFKSPGQCKSCKAPIEWWLTTTKKWMPFNLPVNSRGSDAYKDERAICHFITCPDAKEHRSKAKKVADKAAEGVQLIPTPETVPQTEELLSREAAWFAKRHNARLCIVLCDGQLQAFAARKDADAAQLMSDLAALGEAVKQYLEAKHAEV